MGFKGSAILCFFLLKRLIYSFSLGQVGLQGLSPSTPHHGDTWQGKFFDSHTSNPVETTAPTNVFFFKYMCIGNSQKSIAPCYYMDSYKPRPNHVSGNITTKSTRKHMFYKHLHQDDDQLPKHWSEDCKN